MKSVCNNCGKEVEENSVFCSECGNKVLEDINENQDVKENIEKVYSEEQEVNETSKEIEIDGEKKEKTSELKKKKNRKIMMILLWVFFCPIMLVNKCYKLIMRKTGKPYSLKKGIIISIAVCLVFGSIFNFFNSRYESLVMYKMDYIKQKDNYYMMSSTEKDVKTNYEVNEKNLLTSAKIEMPDLIKEETIKYEDNQVKCESNVRYSSSDFAVKSLYTYTFTRDENNNINSINYEFEQQDIQFCIASELTYNDGRIDSIVSIGDEASGNHSYESIQFEYYEYNGDVYVVESRYQESENNISFQTTESTAIYLESDIKKNLLSELGYNSLMGELEHNIYNYFGESDLIENCTYYDIDKILYANEVVVGIPKGNDAYSRYYGDYIDSEEAKFFYNEDGVLTGLDYSNKSSYLSRPEEDKEKIKEERIDMYVDDKASYFISEDDFSKVEQLVEGVNNTLEKKDKISLNSKKEYALIYQYDVKRDIITETKRFIDKQDKLYKKIKDSEADESYFNTVMEFLEKEMQRKGDELELKQQTQSIESQLITGVVPNIDPNVDGSLTSAINSIKTMLSAIENTTDKEVWRTSIKQFNEEIINIDVSGREWFEDFSTISSGAYVFDKYYPIEDVDTIIEDCKTFLNKYE